MKIILFCSVSIQGMKQILIVYFSRVLMYSQNKKCNQTPYHQQTWWTRTATGMCPCRSTWPS